MSARHNSGTCYREFIRISSPFYVLPARLPVVGLKAGEHPPTRRLDRCRVQDPQSARGGRGQAQLRRGNAYEATYCRVEHPILTGVVEAAYTTPVLTLRST
jgi:hypothetical protein